MNLLILVLAIAIPSCILYSSGKSNEGKSLQECESRPTSQRPEHEMIDNQPSTLSWIVAVIVCVVLAQAFLHGAQ